jgi:hypothetical protein
MNRQLLQLIGVILTVGLALVSNNAFVYIISILIIATIITELEFLEKLMAILWKNSDYFTSRTEIEKERMKQDTQEQKNSEPPKDKELKDKLVEFEKKNQEMEDINRTLGDENKKYGLYYFFERTHRLIFSSQIIFLKKLRNSDDYKIDLRLAVMYYRTTPVYPTYSVENYFGFLKNFMLVGISHDNGSDFYYLTVLGNDFLRYISDNKLIKSDNN